MTRHLAISKRVALLGLALGAAACTPPETSVQAKLEQPSAIAISDSLVFVGSSRTKELRVFDTTTSQFRRAPNPIYPLSIPTAGRPMALAVGGGSIFAALPAERKVDRISIGELRRIGSLAVSGAPLVPGTPVAMAGSPDGSPDTTLYLAVVGEVGPTPCGSKGNALYTVRLSSSGVEPEVKCLADLGDITPADIRLSGDKTRLAIADAAADEANGRGGLAVLDIASGAVKRALVGGPARKVLWVQSVDAKGVLVDTVLLAMLEPSSCDSAGKCAGGIVGVSVASVGSGAAAPKPMTVPGLGNDMALASEVAVGGWGAPIGRVLAVTSGNGSIYLYDVSSDDPAAHKPLAPTPDSKSLDPYQVAVSSRTSTTDPLGAPTVARGARFDPSNNRLYVLYEAGASGSPALVTVDLSLASSGSGNAGVLIFR